MRDLEAVHAAGFRSLAIVLMHGYRYPRHEQLIAEAWNGTFVSRHTVESHLSHIFSKLGLASRVELAVCSPAAVAPAPSPTPCPAPG